MADAPKYAVKNSHLITRRTVIVTDVQAAIFLGLVRRRDNDEIGEDVCLTVPGVKLCYKTVSNRLPAMGDLIGLINGEEAKQNGQQNGNPADDAADKKPKKKYRHRWQLRDWAIDNRLVIKLNGEWQLNDELLIQQPVAG